MASSDALITYSRMETFCVPVIEAWMCGKPVIASETIPVMIDNPDDRLGLTVDEYKTEALESALVKIIKMRADYDADYIKNYAMHHFSEESIASRLIEIYESIGV